MAGKSQHAELVSVVQRRPVGKAGWRMDTSEVIDAVQELLDVLDQIRLEYPKDAKIQGFVAKGALAGANGMRKLGLMLLYRDEKGELNTNGGTHGNAGG